MSQRRDVAHIREQRRKRQEIGVCVFCGSSDRVHAHHIWQYAKGGSELPPELISKDLISVCDECHRDIHKDRRITVGQIQNRVRVHGTGGR